MPDPVNIVHSPRPTDAQIVQRLAATHSVVNPMELANSDDLWAGWRASVERGEKLTQYAYLTRIADGLASIGLSKNPESLYPLLYAGCARAHGFTPATVSAGEPIGKALDRHGMTVEGVRAHLAAGTLLGAIQSRHAPTTAVRLTRDAVGALDEASKLARSLLRVDGLSDPEVRALPMRGFHALPPQFQEIILRAGAGEELGPVIVFRPDERNPELPGDLVSIPQDYGAFLKLHFPCWVTGIYPTPHSLNDLHHVRCGEVEARPNDETPEVVVGVQRLAHIPLPCVTQSGAAHSRAYVVGQDSARLASLNRWQACAVRAYAAYGRKEDWRVWAERANKERLAS